MIEIELTIARNLVTRTLLEQKDIPCLCRISGPNFELSFIEPLPPGHGKVTDWSAKRIDERTPAYGGGKYSHNCFGKVTLLEIEEGKYKIVDLTFFNHDVGWCTIIINGEYGPIGSFWDEEE